MVVNPQLFIGNSGQGREKKYPAKGARHHGFVHETGVNSIEVREQMRKKQKTSPLKVKRRYLARRPNADGGQQEGNKGGGI